MTYTFFDPDDDSSAPRDDDDLVWDIYTNYKLREKLKRDKRSESLGKLINSLPPEVLDKLRKTAELPGSTGVINDED